MWHFICNQKDIDDLMTVFNYFHDSCIKELNYISGAYVDGNLAMNPMNTKRCLKVIVNRQEENPIAIEMEFSNLIKLNLEPSNELYTCEIGQVDLYIENGKIYWIADFDAQDLTHFKGTWICAEKLRWRFAEKYIGESAVYGTAAVDV